MQIITSLAEMRKWSHEQLASRKRIGFVPTMGAFHEGHLSLMRKAAKISVQAHINAMKFCSPGKYEYQLEAEMQRPDLWDDREVAEKLSREKSSVEAELELYPELDNETCGFAALVAPESAAAARELVDADLESLQPARDAPRHAPRQKARRHRAVSLRADRIGDRRDAGPGRGAFAGGV